MNAIETQKSKAGFTLIELMIATTILILLGISMTALIGQNMNLWRVEEGLANVNTSLRSAKLQLSQEVRDATLAGDAALGVQPLAVAPSVISFQRPLTADGQTWSTPITIQLLNEDANGNLVLDPGEDNNGNGVLDRTIVRTQDGIGANAADGDFTDPGETRTLAEYVDGLAFVLAGNQLTATVTSRKRTSDLNTNAVTDNLTFSVLLVN